MCFPEIFAEMIDKHENLALKTVIEIFEQTASAFESDLKETAGNKKDPDALHSSYQRKITASVNQGPGRP